LRYDYAQGMNDLRTLYGNACADKGVKNRGRCEGQLEFAHVKPTGLCSRGRGRADRYHDILRNLDCYVLLCARHHRAFDRDKWTNMIGS